MKGTVSTCCIGLVLAGPVVTKMLVKRLVHISSGRNGDHVAVTRGKGIKVKYFVLVWERQVWNNGLQGRMTMTK